MSRIFWGNGELCVLRSVRSTCSSFLMRCRAANISWTRHILFNICLIRGQEKGVGIATYRLTAALSYLGFVLLGTNTVRFYGVDNANCKYLRPLICYEISLMSQMSRRPVIVSGRRPEPIHAVAHRQQRINARSYQERSGKRANKTTGLGMLLGKFGTRRSSRG